MVFLEGLTSLAVYVDAFKRETPIPPGWAVLIPRSARHGTSVPTGEHGPRQTAQYRVHIRTSDLEEALCPGKQGDPLPRAEQSGGWEFQGNHDRGNFWGAKKILGTKWGAEFELVAQKVRGDASLLSSFSTPTRDLREIGKNFCIPNPGNRSLKYTPPPYIVSHFRVLNAFFEPLTVTIPNVTWQRFASRTERRAREEAKRAESSTTPPLERAPVTTMEGLIPPSASRDRPEAEPYPPRGSTAGQALSGQSGQEKGKGAPQQEGGGGNNLAQTRGDVGGDKVRPPTLPTRNAPECFQTPHPYWETPHPSPTLSFNTTSFALQKFENMTVNHSYFPLPPPMCAELWDEHPWGTQVYGCEASHTFHPQYTGGYSNPPLSLEKLRLITPCHPLTPSTIFGTIADGGGTFLATPPHSTRPAPQRGGGKGTPPPLTQISLAVLGALDIAAEAGRPISGWLILPEMDPLADEDTVFVLDFRQTVQKALKYCTQVKIFGGVYAHKFDVHRPWTSPLAHGGPLHCRLLALHLSSTQNYSWKGGQSPAAFVTLPPPEGGEDLSAAIAFASEEQTPVPPPIQETSYIRLDSSMEFSPLTTAEGVYQEVNRILSGKEAPVGGFTSTTPGRVIDRGDIHLRTSPYANWRRWDVEVPTPLLLRYATLLQAEWPYFGRGGSRPVAVFPLSGAIKGGGVFVVTPAKSSGGRTNWYELLDQILAVQDLGAAIVFAAPRLAYSALVKVNLDKVPENGEGLSKPRWLHERAREAGFRLTLAPSLQFPPQSAQEQVPPVARSMAEVTGIAPKKSTIFAPPPNEIIVQAPISTAFKKVKLAVALFGEVTRLVPWHGGGLLEHRLYRAEYRSPASVALATGCQVDGMVFAPQRTGSRNTPLFRSTIEEHGGTGTTWQRILRAGRALGSKEALASASSDLALPFFGPKTPQVPSGENDTGLSPRGKGDSSPPPTPTTPGESPPEDRPALRDGEEARDPVPEGNRSEQQALAASAREREENENKEGKMDDD